MVSLGHASRKHNLVSVPIIILVLIAIASSPISIVHANSSHAFTVIEVPYSVCVVQVGFVQQDGSTIWISTGVTGTPISDCQNTTEYFTDVMGGTVAFHQFILNGTSFEIVAATATLFTATTLF
jgi:hypothetical protein